MQLVKVVNKTLGSVGQTIQDTAETMSIVVGDEGLKTTTRLTFGILNNSLLESNVISGLETEYNIAQFKIAHAKKVGRPPKSK
jgi:hypothetical protein